MVNNKVRQNLLNRKVTLGTWIQIGHPAVAEVLSNTPYDWIATDAEHTDIELEAFSNIARGIHGRGPVPMVRVRENDTIAIRQVLDCGAMGVIVPLINNAEQARKAVAAAKYPPDGIRGFAFTRANNYGVDFEEYVKTANDNISVVVMIESKEAIENIDEILAVNGVDGVFIGPYDLSGSYGIPGQTSDQCIQDACEKVAKACERANKSAGLHVVIPTEESITKAIKDGFTFIALGIDTVFMHNASKQAYEIAKKVLP